MLFSLFFLEMADTEYTNDTLADFSLVIHFLSGCGCYEYFVNTMYTDQHKSPAASRR